MQKKSLNLEQSLDELVIVILPNFYPFCMCFWGGAKVLLKLNLLTIVVRCLRGLRVCPAPEAAAVFAE